MPGQIPLHTIPWTGTGPKWQFRNGIGKTEADKIDLHIEEDGYFNSIGSNLASDTLPPFTEPKAYEIVLIPGYGNGQIIGNGELRIDFAKSKVQVDPTFKNIPGEGEGAGATIINDGGIITMMGQEKAGGGGIFLNTGVIHNSRLSGLTDIRAKDTSPLLKGAELYIKYGTFQNAGDLTGATFAGGLGYKYVYSLLNEISVEDDGIFSNGLLAAGGGNVEIGQYDLLSLRDNAAFNNESGGLFVISGRRVDARGDDPKAPITKDNPNNQPNLMIGAGTTFTNKGIIQNTGMIDVYGTLDHSGTSFQNNMGIRVKSGGTLKLSADITLGGRSQLETPDQQDLKWGNKAPITIDKGGTIIGKTHVTSGTVLIDGTIAPGNSAGGMKFGGDLILSETSTKEIELGGTNSFEFHRNDTQHDFTEIQGDLLINGGELNVSLIDGFELSLDQEFIIAKIDGELTGTFNGLEQGAIVGKFDSVYGQTGMNLFITYEAGDGNDIALYTEDNLFGIRNL